VSKQRPRDSGRGEKASTRVQKRRDSGGSGSGRERTPPARPRSADPFFLRRESIVGVNEIGLDGLANAILQKPVHSVDDSLVRQGQKAPIKFLIDYALKTLAPASGAQLNAQDVDKLIKWGSWFLDRDGKLDDFTLAQRLLDQEILATLIAIWNEKGEVEDPTIYLSHTGNSILAAYRGRVAEPGPLPRLLPIKDEIDSPDDILIPDVPILFHPLRSSQLRDSASWSPDDIILPEAPPLPLPLPSKPKPEVALQATMAASMIDTFLTEITDIVRASDGLKLLQYLPIEPTFPQAYESIIGELRSSFTYDPQSPLKSKVALESKINNGLRGVRMAGGDTWSAFLSFMTQYLLYLRDLEPDNLLSTYDQLTELLQKCNSALGASELGVVMLPTAIQYSTVLARLALGLEKQPHLIAHLVEQSTDESGERVSLPERAANTIRQTFVACLNENAQYPFGQQNSPIGRHAGIYKLANMCLKIFFRCKNTKSAEQIFTNIGAKSPPIDIYPRAERVTYLYYLGRFYFSVNHFYRAQAALQSAYSNCLTHPSAVGQRKLILVYLVASNIILGKFPSAELYRRAEAKGFQEAFQPICDSIRKGDLATFRQLTDLSSEHAQWLLRHRILLQIQSRCEILVWRSLSRCVWNLVGFKSATGDKRVPFLELQDLVNAARALEIRAMDPRTLHNGVPGQRHTNWALMSNDQPQGSAYEDPDFEGVNDDDDYYDHEEDPFLLPDLPMIESIVSSLVGQGLINGYISTQKKLAIKGASSKPALEAGWPNVWQLIYARNEKAGEEIPGWKTARSGRNGGGMIVNVNGARPVGL
jgi:nuclear mRNA export protein PCID2/THP1